jgi:hypothetical protein
MMIPLLSGSANMLDGTLLVPRTKTAHRQDALLDCAVLDDAIGEGRYNGFSPSHLAGGWCPVYFPRV